MTKGKLRKTDDDDARCEAATVQTAWKLSKGVDLRCPYFARIFINKKRLCTKHAHLEALAIAFEKGQATVIIIPEVRLVGQRVQVYKGKP